MRMLQKWEQYALEDLRTAETLLKSDWVSYRNVCYLSQQAAEKIIKSLYVRQNQEFDRTHNLNSLKNKLNGKWKFKDIFTDLSELSEWALESRYPGEWQDVTETEAKTAYETASKIIKCIKDETLKL